MTDPYWERLRVAEHEACHAIAAQEMGLPVAWVTIDPGCDEGIDFTAAVKIPEDRIDRERDCFAICVATAAPAHIHSHRDFEIGRYASIERSLAYELGGRYGIAHTAIYDRCAEIVDERFARIIDLSQRLVEEGTVVLDEAVPG